MNPGVRFGHGRTVKLGAGSGLGLLLIGIVALVGVLLTSVVLSLLLAPFRVLLRRGRGRAPAVERTPEPADLRTGTDPAWQPSEAIEAQYEEVS